MILPLALEHVEQAAKLHRAALTGLLTELGEPAARAFYAGAVRSGAASGFVSVDGREVRGLVLGSVHPDRLGRAAARSAPAGMAAGLVLAGLRRPAALARLLKSFLGPDEVGFDRRAPELTYLAVAPGYRGSGLGGALVDEFTRSMRAAGVAAYELSVDDDNANAAAFYERLGFKPVGRYREFGALHRRYRLRL